MSAPEKRTPQAERQRMVTRLGVLRGQRANWDPHYRDLAENISPRRSRFFQTEVTSQGQKKNQAIINSTPTDAIRTTSSGMMAGFTSPAREWYRLTVSEPTLADADGVAEFLHDVAQIMFTGLARTNLYDELAELYDDLPLFGTGVILVEEDSKDTLRAYSIPLGSYWLAQSARGVVDTLYYETTLTVRQLVEKFGLESCSVRVQDLYRENRLDMQVEVVHVVEPRPQHDPSAVLDPKQRPWASFWWEKSNDEGTGLLEESGYHENPILAPRWTVVDNDVYGSSPGMQVLGDCKALQLYEKHKGRAIEMIVDPPVVASGSMQNNPVSLLPGEVNYTDGAAAEVKPIVIVPPQAVELIDLACRQHEQRIKRGFFADLWLMLSQEEQGQPITAREVAERHLEKMQQLGSVMQRLENELLKPLVLRAFRIFERAGYFPPPPRALLEHKQGVQVEFISIMAQAEKMVAAGAIQQVTAFAAGLSATWPGAVDTVNADKALAEYAQSVGANPTMLRPDAEVKQLRAQQAKQQEAAAAAQQALAASQAAKNLGSANTSGDSVLSRVLGGPAAAQVGGEESLQ